MTSKVFALDTKPGIQRDGTLFDKDFYTDGRWVRFQRGRPRKMAGFRVISDQMKGPSRGMWVYPQDAFNGIFSGYSDGLQELFIDDNGIGSGITDFTLTDFTASPNNLWQFDGFYNVTGGVQDLLAHPGQNLAAIDSTVDTPVLVGDINGSTMSQIGVFTDSVTTASGSPIVTIAALNIRIGAGQSVSGAGIPSGTTVSSVSGLNVTLSANCTASATVTATFDNNVEVSGGVVSLHPYIFVYGNDGLIRNCSAGDPSDWVSADANEVNVATGKIVKGLPVRGGSNSPSGLFWSLDSLIRVSFSPQTLGVSGTANFGVTNFWRFDIISSQTSILSSQCVIEYDGIFYWIGVDRFLLYNGVVKEIPNPMNQDYFFDNLNYTQRQKVWATKVPRFGEVWWFYPRGDSEECNDAIIYNVRENTWYDAGTALGTRRSAGYFSQVFAFPVAAGWDAQAAETVTTETATVTSGSPFFYLAAYNINVALSQVLSGTNIPSGTTVESITSSNINALTSLVGGSLYSNGSYTDVPLTGGSGFGATADVTVSGGAVTVVTIVLRGAGYVAGDSLSADDADLGGGGGSGFSIDVDTIFPMGIEMSANATGTGSVTITFSTQDDIIKVYQHEIGVDEIDGQSTFAIQSFVETNDLSWVAGGPSQQSPVGENRWLRLERVEPDFILSGEMNLFVTGRPYAQSEDKTSDPFVFDQTTNKIDMKEQRREMRLRFESDEAGGDYQMGKVILNATFGDVRGY
jgi:hypothetical protein